MKVTDELEKAMCAVTVASAGYLNALANGQTLVLKLLKGWERLELWSTS